MAMATIRTLRVRDKENSIISKEIDLDVFTKQILGLFYERELSLLPQEEVVEFLKKAVENHNNMTRQIVAFWCPELQKQV